jgi:DNA-binding beta-propeller fold protein YncE
MNKKWATLSIILVILIFLGFIIYDVAFKGEESAPEPAAINDNGATDMWEVAMTADCVTGKLRAVAVSFDGNIFLAGDSFIAAFSADLKPLWEIKTTYPVTALSVSGDTIYAATQELIQVFDPKGVSITEWGPFEDKAIITSVSSNKSYVAFADAGNKIIFILDKKGEVRYMAGQTGEPFIVPSPYFDVALTADNRLIVANTGQRRVETRSLSGTLLGFFGEPGTAPGAFCGCCNPAHFALIPGGFVTAEKGINRIKLLNAKGEFTEFVSSVNKFVAPLPLDVASADGKTIYGANPADNKVYVFMRK